MVWMINKLSGSMYFREVNGDMICQCTSIMFNVYAKKYDVYQIYALWCCGVNIFNVDLTILDVSFFNDIKSFVESAQQLHEPEVYRPIAISVTVSAKEPLEIDDRVDFIVLKDAENKEDIANYRKSLKDQSTPILLMVTKCDIADLWFLVKFSDGVVLNFETDTSFEFELCRETMKLCREASKPVFLKKSSIITEYDVDDRRLLNLASFIVEYRLDGVLIEDSEKAKSPPEIIIRAFVISMSNMENGIKPSLECSKLSDSLKIPVLPPLSAALAASLAALKSGASAIMLLTVSGRSAKWISKASPPCHVLAITIRDSTARRLHMYRKIIPLLYTKPRAANWLEECRNRVRFGTGFALASTLCSGGAKLVVLAPSDEGAGYCNSFSLVSIPYRCSDRMDLE